MAVTETFIVSAIIRFTSAAPSLFTRSWKISNKQPLDVMLAVSGEKNQISKELLANNWVYFMYLSVQKCGHST